MGQMFTSDEKELIDFGIRQGIHNVMNWMIVVLIGLFFYVPFWQSLLFYFCFCAVRVYAGGYHSKTRAGCYLSSAAGIGICFAVLTMAELQKIPSMLIMAGTLIVILFLSPMDNPHKKLSTIEKSCFRKKLIKVLIVETSAFLIAVIVDMPRLYNIVMLAMLFVAVMLIVGRVNMES